MASFLYNNAVSDFYAGNMQTGHTYYVMLVTSSYTPSRSHDKRNDITNEVVGAGYVANGTPIVVSITNDDAGNRTVISFNEPSWAASTITARRAVVYRSRGGASSADELMCCFDFGGDITSTAGTFALDQTTPFYINHPAP
jgi:hypothetical protein